MNYLETDLVVCKVMTGPVWIVFRKLFKYFYTSNIFSDQGTFRPMTGFGEYLPLPPFSPHLYDKLNERRSAALTRARPVARTAEDMAVVTNGEDAVPPPVTPDKAGPTNQQVSFVRHS